MAIGLKYWLGVLAAVCTALAIWMLPPAGFDRRSRAPFPEEVRFRRVTEELQLAHGVLMARRWSDSLSALAVETAIEGLALGHTPSELVTPEGVAEWRDLLSNRLASLRPRDPDMVVGRFFVDDRYASLDGVLLPRFGLRTQVYVGVHDGSPYCLLVQPERYAITNRQLRSAQTLEICGFHAKYGMPGSRIGAWLESGGFQFAMDQRLAYYEAIIAADRANDALIMRVPFGIDRPMNESVPLAGCLAGKAESCALASTEPRQPIGGALQPLVDGSPMSFIGVGAFSSTELRNRAILSELEAEHGVAAFQRFWSSEAAVPVAFRAAFGTDAGAWMREWMQADGGAYRAGAMPSGGSVAWSLLTMIALSALVTLVAARRRVA